MGLETSAKTLQIESAGHHAGLLQGIPKASNRLGD
jgi:hypothetical protein